MSGTVRGYTDSGDDYSSSVSQVPDPVRIYDYLIGGKDNFAADRAAAEKMMQSMPNVREAALANRGFLVRAVETMAGAGITQFLDLGTGLPTSPNVHEVARRTTPDARVVYVDNQPVVTMFSRALRESTPGVVAVEQDLREPHAVLADPDLRENLDLDQPLGLLLVAVLHFVDTDAAAEAVSAYVRRLASGSMMAISVACADDLNAPDLIRIRRIYENSPTPFVFHNTAQVTAMFDGLELLEPGLVDVSQWRHDGSLLTYSGMSFLAGVARKP